MSGGAIRIAPSDHVLPGDNRSVLVPRTYQLLILLPRAVDVEVGRLGRFVFPAGAYVYTGSAVRNMDSRVQRHQAREKGLRWHLDYLSTLPGVSVREIARHPEPECEINQRTAGEVLVPGFGASDCRKGCGSHLKFLGAIDLG